MEDRIDRVTAFLFPHPYATEGDIKRILSFFDSLTICQPWNMEHLSIPLESGAVMVLHPPELLRPVEGFHSLLSEYKNWIRQYPEKGYASTLSVIRQIGSGDSTWDIRRSIRRPDERKGVPESPATQWHLVLHLARETEESLREAAEVLTNLKEKGSPLRAAIMEGESPGPLDDLSDFKDEQGMDEEFVERVLDAWRGLFGELLDENAVLVTLSRALFEGLSDLWSEYRAGEGMPESSLCFCWPDLSQAGVEELHSSRAKVEARLMEIKDAVKGIRSDPAGQMKVLGELARGQDSSMPSEGKGMIRFHARFFAPDPGTPSRKKFLSTLSGKLLFLLEESCRG